MNRVFDPESFVRYRQDLLLGFTLLLLLCATWLVFAPGISGEFIFDDYPNLSGLSRINEQPGLASTGQYIFDGISSSLGRPLSLLTFALQHNSWGQNPGDFIQVNILIHMCNGALLCWCLIRLFRLVPNRPELSNGLALLAMLVWLIFPIQSSAVLYVVQRMALLAGTCLFLGFLLYLLGRERLARGQPFRGGALMTAGVMTGVGLGVLAKENAVLFPLLILVTEYTLLWEQPRTRAWYKWATICLGLPLLLLAGYLLSRLPSDWGATSPLGVTTVERLMTQPRILFLYLQKLLLPSLYSIRIMYDDITVSKSFGLPWTTWPSIAAWGGLIWLGLSKRRIFPFISFAILWFLASHLLESSFIPLEIAFDHRNYVAIVGISVALVYGSTVALSHPLTQRIRLPIAIGLVAYLLFLGFAQWQTSRLWGQPYELMAYWGKVQPNSRRVSFELADAHFRNWRPIEAMQEHQRAFNRWPGDTAFVYGLLSKGCALPEYPVPSYEQIKSSLSIYNGHVLSTLNLLNRIIIQSEMGLCGRYSPVELRRIVDLTFSTPAFLNKSPVNHHLMLSRLYYLEPNITAALDQLDMALASKPSLAVYELAIRWSLDADQWERALKYLTAAEGASDVNPIVKMSYAPVLAQLKQQISIESSAAKPSP